MTTSASAATIPTPTLKPMVHLCAAENVGLECASWSMLFPAAAFHDPQCQEEKKHRETETKGRRARVQYTEGKTLHVFHHGNVSKQPCHPAGLQLDAVGQKTEQEQAHHAPETDH